MAKPIKKVAFAWQGKATLRKIREECQDPGSALAVYTALTVIASDKSSDTFQTTHNWIAHISGFSRRTVLERLKVLQRIGVVEISTPKMKAPSSYKLIRSALAAQRCETTAQRCAIDEALPLHTSEEREEIEEERAVESSSTGSIREHFKIPLSP